MLLLKGPAHRGPPFPSLVYPQSPSLSRTMTCAETGNDATYDAVTYEDKGTRFQGALPLPRTTEYLALIVSGRLLSDVDMHNSVFGRLTSRNPIGSLD